MAEMTFYESRVLPYLVNLAMSTKAIRSERQRCLAEVTGTVLEVGFGTGLNLPFYPATVAKVVGLDPSMTAARLAEKRISAAPFPVELMGVSAERIPVADASFDSIVSTFTLCTIPDVVGALVEMRRTLRADGRFYFVEHGRADDPGVERWQERLNPLQRRIFGGCNLNRPIATLIMQAGFDMERLDNAYLKGAPRFGGFLYRGVARPAKGKCGHPDSTSEHPNHAGERRALPSAPR
jgi:SAM-dependent methyltransferase